jgi:hypothetical protein
MAMVFLNAQINPATDGNECAMSFVTSGTGATVVTADDARSVSAARYTVHSGATYLVTGLNSVATTFTAQYRNASGATACNFADRHMIVIPY